MSRGVVHIGTSGYHFKDWAGPFYPSELKQDQWLEYYSQEFDCVEINSTYYGLPKRQTVARWARQTPAGFAFHVKLHADSTHKRATEGTEISELLDVLQPLMDESKLAGLLAQFPASFRAGDEEREYIRKLRQQVGNLPLFMEFRHSTWDTTRAIDFCRDEGLGWVAVDLPSIRGLPRARAAVTGPVAYVRLHGRNTKTWYNQQLGDRYDWDYTDEELRGWLPRLATMTERADETYLFFNNCHAGQAVKNAVIMKELMRQEQFEVA